MIRAAGTLGACLLLAAFTLAYGEPEVRVLGSAPMPNRYDPGVTPTEDPLRHIDVDAAFLRPMGLSYTFGSGSKNTDLSRASLLLHWNAITYRHGWWELAGYWELGYGIWDSKADEFDYPTARLEDLSIMPVFAWRRSEAGLGMIPVIEGGIGFHWVSESEIADRDLGSNFQFGDYIGASVIFVGEVDLELGYRYEHVSNADIGSANAGMDFHVVKLAVHF